MKGKRLLTSTELAAILKLAVITVQREAARGAIPGKKIAGRWRFDPSVVEAFLKEQAKRSEKGDSEVMGTLKEINEKLDTLNAQLTDQLSQLKGGSQ